MNEKPKMSVLATPKKNPYVVKGADVTKIIDSRNSSNDILIIKDRAQKFALNNLKKKFKEQ